MTATQTCRGRGTALQQSFGGKRDKQTHAKEKKRKKTTRNGYVCALCSHHLIGRSLLCRCTWPSVRPLRSIRLRTLYQTISRTMGNRPKRTCWRSHVLISKRSAHAASRQIRCAFQLTVELNGNGLTAPCAVLVDRFDPRADGHDFRPVLFPRQVSNQSIRSID